MSGTINTSATETIREAARLMRERAQAACPGPWFTTGKSAQYGGLVAEPCEQHPEHHGYDGHLIGESMTEVNREHVAGWHPGTTLAVADWLDAVANANGVDQHALAVARAYLAPTSTGQGAAR